MKDPHPSLPSPENDEIIFAQEDEEIPITLESSESNDSWKILIVDDDAVVHEVTKLALTDFVLEGKSLTFVSAYSAKEAKQLIQLHPDTAIVFLDVVMETENAGLQVVQYIREELGNPLVRIILRTGQPGQAPENVVAINYGIDDYKTKTELTSQKLFLTVVMALRAFSTLIKMMQASQNLELELTRHQHIENSLRISALQEREKNRQLERAASQVPLGSPSSGQPVSPQPEQRERIETLGQLVTELTQVIVHSPDQAGALHTMSMVTRLARMVLRITEEHSAKLGISQSKLAVLMYLSHEPERCASPSSLAKHCGVSRAAMTGLLDGLEQEEYVERDDHPSDRRALKIKLTLKGQQFLDWIAPPGQYQMLELMDTLDEAERQRLTELVMDVLKLFEEK